MVERRTKEKEDSFLRHSRMHLGASVVTLISEHRRRFRATSEEGSPDFPTGREGLETVVGDIGEDRKLWTGIPTWISNGDATAARLLRPSSWHVPPKLSALAPLDDPPKSREA